MPNVLPDVDSEMADLSVPSGTDPRVHRPRGTLEQSQEAARMALPVSPAKQPEQAGLPHGLPPYITRNKLETMSLPVSITLPKESPSGRFSVAPPGLSPSGETEREEPELTGVDKCSWSIFADHMDDPLHFKRVKDLYRKKYAQLIKDATAAGFPDQTQECRDQVQGLWKEYLRQQYLIEFGEGKTKETRNFPPRYEEIAELALKEHYRAQKELKSAVEKVDNIDVSVPWTGDNSSKIGHVPYRDQIKKIYDDWIKKIPNLEDPMAKPFAHQWGEWITAQRKNCYKRCRRKERTLTMKEEWFWWNVRQNMISTNPEERDDLPTWEATVVFGWQEPRSQVFQQHLIDSKIAPERLKDPEDTRLDSTLSSLLPERTLESSILSTLSGPHTGLTPRMKSTHVETITISDVDMEEGELSSEEKKPPKEPDSKDKFG